MALGCLLNSWCVLFNRVKDKSGSRDLVCWRYAVFMVDDRELRCKTNSKEMDPNKNAWL